MRIVITGSNGQLGHDCVRLFEANHDLIPLSSRELDISQGEAVESMVRAIRPEVVLNCAAFTQVDACETETARAMAVNGRGPQYLAEAVARHGGHLVHISTDYVFDGRRPFPHAYSENDTPAPLSQYGKSKLAGEEAIRTRLPTAAIVRTAWVYGRQGQNFLKKILRLVLQVKPPRLKIVHDQYGSPTWSRRLAQQLERLIEVRGGGVYHATAEGFCTWYELARYFLKCMGLAYPLEPCTTAEFPTPAPRPANSILENRRLKAEGLNVMRPWQEDVTEFVRLYRDDLCNEVEQG